MHNYNVIVKLSTDGTVSYHSLMKQETPQEIEIAKRDLMIVTMWTYSTIRQNLTSMPLFGLLIYSPAV